VVLYCQSVKRERFLAPRVLQCEEALEAHLAGTIAQHGVET